MAVNLYQTSIFEPQLPMGGEGVPIDISPFSQAPPGISSTAPVQSSLTIPLVIHVVKFVDNVGFVVLLL